MRALLKVKYVSLCTILAIGCGAQTTEVKLSIAAVSISDDASVKFRAITTDDRLPNVGEDIGQSDHFHIYSVPSIGLYDDVFRKFSYELFAKNVSSSPPRWIHFVLEAVPSGQFMDHVHLLNFTISEGDLTEQGQLRLPLHSLSSDQFLDATIGSATLDVRLGSPQPVPLKLTNKLQEMGIVVQSVELTYDHPEFWTSQAAKLTPNL